MSLGVSPYPGLKDPQKFSKPYLVRLLAIEQKYSLNCLLPCSRGNSPMTRHLQKMLFFIKRHTSILSQNTREEITLRVFLVILSIN
jgi:hypothetical protein